RNLTAPSSATSSGLDDQGLVEGVPPAVDPIGQGVANDATPVDRPIELLVAAQARRLRAHDDLEQLVAVRDLAATMHEQPHTTPEIVSILCAYLRRTRPAYQNLDLTPADQAALQAIREHPARMNTTIDLSGTDLTGGNLSSAPLAGAVLRGTVLNLADLELADLRGAELHAAKLRGARLAGANLDRAGGLNASMLQQAHVDAMTVLPDYIKRIRVKRRWTLVDVPSPELSIGDILRQSRMSAGLTVEDVSRATRVRLSIVHAIETDDFTPCGGDVYARGHIRTLARAVDIDPGPLLQQYDAQYKGKPARKKQAPLSERAPLGEAERIPSNASPAGPRDVSEVEEPNNGRVDFGGLLVPWDARAELLAVRAGEDFVAVTVKLHYSALQLQAFSAPKSEGIWGEVRAEIATDVRAQGGTADEVEGPLGRELRAKVPIQLPDGRGGWQVVRFVGADGPRWFLRGVISGEAAVQPRAATELETIFRETVVVRGHMAMADRAPILLTMPPTAQAIPGDTVLDRQSDWPPSASTA
ncbi:DUF3710 domain-containing protein, partial [Streptomyces sp. 7R007]